MRLPIASEGWPLIVPGFALAGLCAKLLEWDFKLIDCQVHTDHLLSLGAEEYADRQARFALRNASANEPPIRPTPNMTIFLNNG